MLPFERVWLLVRKIPHGRVATYGQLSRMLEGRLTPVGIGWAIRAAKDGVIPWHRVVNSKGGISTEKSSPGVQRAKLRAEGVKFDKEGFIELSRYGWSTGRDSKT
ncbi:MAG: MGMT family protein [Spirochaetia bacterium]|nr:MGMT family protein [Spirochaetia bacterium]